MRESDIRSPDILAEYLRLSATDAARYFAEPESRVPRRCPGCDENHPVAAFTKNGFNLVRCAACDSLYVNPCPTSAALAPFYTDSPSSRYWADVFFPSVAEARRAKIFRPRVERILGLLDSGGRSIDSVVEVGAGAAIFLEEMRRARPSLSLRAIEPGEALAAQCRSKGFETFEGFADVAAGQTGWSQCADLVVCFEVIEHIPDPLAFVNALAALAKPGGSVLMSGLCGDGFDIRVLGANSNAVAPPHHLTFLSVRGAEKLLARAGLQDISVFTPGLLDVDIVANALKADATAVSEPFLRKLLLESDDSQRSAFQAFLRDNRLSSHLWAYGRTRDGGRPFPR